MENHELFGVDPCRVKVLQPLRGQDRWRDDLPQLQGRRARRFPVLPQLRHEDSVVKREDVKREDVKREGLPEKMLWKPFGF